MESSVSLFLRSFVLSCGRPRPAHRSVAIETPKRLDIYFGTPSGVTEISCRMSASPMARQISPAPPIPTRRVVVHSESELPSDLGTTPGGTLYGTTPGGTRIVYERAFLMHMRQSPLSKTPPTLPLIPGITAPATNTKNSRRYYQYANTASQSPKSLSPPSLLNGNNKENGHDSHEERNGHNTVVVARRASEGPFKKHNLDEKKDTIKEEDEDQFAMEM